MKIIFSLIFFAITFLIATQTHAQMGNWVWMKGDSTTNSLGNFGTMGVSSSSNEPPSVYAPLCWTGNDGDFWLFGGVGADSFIHHYNALWKYEPSTNNWTWISGSNQLDQPGVYGTLGIPAPDNIPGSRGFGSLTWTDVEGNLWLFGGDGFDVDGAYYVLADLWKYDISINQWAWMGGYSSGAYNPEYDSYQQFSGNNFPGSSDECTVTWRDGNNDLCFFGGKNNQLRNDVWKYNISTNEWAWMKGGLSANPVYGIQGVEDSANDPGSRMVYSKWIDEQQNLWIFGGGVFGVDYSDLWKLNLSNLEWTWMAGSSVNGDSGSYGNYCDTSNNRHPAHRFENRACWTDSCGNFWMFGGFELSNYFENFESDLWLYNPLDDRWSFAKGDSDINELGDFGTQGIISVTNHPGGRGGSASWKDKNGNFWLFGGLEEIVQGQWKSGNDLWKFIPDLSCIGGTNCYVTAVNETQSSIASPLAFPNPFSIETAITLPFQQKILSVKLFDECGREASFHFQSSIEGHQTSIIIERGNLCGGVYFLSIISKEKREVVPLVIE